MPTLLASAVASAQALKNEEPPVEPSPAKKFEVAVPPRTASLNEFQKFPEEDEETKDDDVDDEPIEPAYYSQGTAIPVFTPTMEQFRSFPKFVDKINHYGMKSGIVKIIPPKEWSDALPPLGDKVRDIKIKNPIEQHIAGSSGEYRQTNIQKQRTYNLPEWRHLCEGSNHQPPARRGERRTVQTQPVPTRRSTRSRKKGAEVKLDEDPDDAQLEKASPPTPESPEKLDDATPEPSFGRQPRMSARVEETPAPETETTGGRQPRKSTRRKTAKERAVDRELADEAAYDGFDYRINDADKYTAEHCVELEKAYWRTLTYNSPLYGADMPGSLFDESTTSWNVAKLENLLDCLGKKLPGVNTAYLYLGMWKSTFSWHLEDMDLYSINYIHFGAPKQWYSISSSDKPKFEQVMKSIWPNEAKKCSQFLRHKTFLVSPTLLAQHGIKVNKLVHRQGEFVITFPFGYHSGYNLGYNCAESVNFATQSWLKFGREAKKCECIDDAVFVDIDEIERKLLGLPTDDEDEDDDDEEEFGYYDDDGQLVGRPGDFPTPPESVEGKLKRGRPRKRKAEDGGDDLAHKKARKKLPKHREPCVLCPNDMPCDQLLDTENGGQAHRLCAIYTPETYFKLDAATGKEIVANIEGIPKARLELKCMFCRQKKGSCFQCSAKKCVRAYHATCAAAAGVEVNMVEVTVVGKDGENYQHTNIDYRCKVHRSKRPKDWDIERLETDPQIRNYCTVLQRNDIIQMQYLGGEIFAGFVLENRKNEEMVLVQILPRRDIMEIEWKWVLAQDSSKTYFPEGTRTAPLYPDPKYLPGPKSNEEFLEGYSWGELVIAEEFRNPDQAPVEKWWYYLGEQSTEYIPKYSEDPTRRIHNPESIPKPQKQVRVYRPPAQPAQAPMHHHHPSHSHHHQQQQQYAMPQMSYHGPHMDYHGNGHPQYAQNLPSGYRPQFHNHPTGGYAPPSPNHHYVPQMPPMSPRAAPVASMSSSPHFNAHHPTAAPPGAPGYTPQMSLPLMQLFGEAPRAYPQPNYPMPPPHQQQQHRGGFMGPPPMMHHPPPTFSQPQQYHSSPMPQFSSSPRYHSSPMPVSSLHAFHLAKPQQQQQPAHSPHHQPNHHNNHQQPQHPPQHQPDQPQYQPQQSPLARPPPPHSQPGPENKLSFIDSVAAAAFSGPAKTEDTPGNAAPATETANTGESTTASITDITAAIAKLAKEKVEQAQIRLQAQQGGAGQTQAQKA